MEEVEVNRLAIVLLISNDEILLRCSNGKYLGPPCIIIDNKNGNADDLLEYIKEETEKIVCIEIKDLVSIDKIIFTQKRSDKPEFEIIKIVEILFGSIEEKETILPLGFAKIKSFYNVLKKFDDSFHGFICNTMKNNLSILNIVH